MTLKTNDLIRRRRTPGALHCKNSTRNPAIEFVVGVPLGDLPGVPTFWKRKPHDELVGGCVNAWVRVRELAAGLVGG